MSIWGIFEQIRTKNGKKWFLKSIFKNWVRNEPPINDILILVKNDCLPRLFLTIGVHTEWPYEGKASIGVASWCFSVCTMIQALGF